ncbi:MAG: hypothetical protein KC457_29395 [Myxococcales bacterium]|nr:hypothetical protein [Myxococcales bacterium]
MANITAVFQDALADQARAALVEVVTRNPKITLKDLRQLVADSPALGAITLDELTGGGKAMPAGKGRRKGGGGGGKAAAGGGGKRNVRTESGREAFDAEVLAALKAAGGESVGAGELRAALDADPTQLRAALNRLIEKGVLTFTGKARGTRYTLI